MNSSGGRGELKGNNDLVVEGEKRCVQGDQGEKRNDLVVVGQGRGGGGGEGDQQFSKERGSEAINKNFANKVKSTKSNDLTFEAIRATGHLLRK